MESQKSEMLTSYDEDEIAEKAHPEIEGEYFLVPDIPEDVEEDIQAITDEESPSISQMCRICASVKVNLVPIFEGDGLEHDLCKKIDKHLPMKVTKEDTLPLQLCYHCAATLLAWDELSDGCLKAQNKLLLLQEQQRRAQVEAEKLQVLEEAVKVGEKSVEENNEPKFVNVQTAGGSYTERSSRAQTSFKVFLDTQSILWRKRKITDKSILNSQICEESGDAKDELKHEDQGEETEFQSGWELNNSGDEEFQWKCTNCEQKFESAIELNDHAKLHNSKKSYRCRECGRGFKLKDSYIRHSRIHNDERPYTCHVCGKQFRDSGGLSRHLRDVHAKVKNFPCDLCGSSFASKSTRDDHRRTHTGERPYVCDCCGKTFKSKASLYIHRKLHTDEFPHPCAYCAKKFRRRQEMLAHVSTHTGEKNYVCDVCQKCFRVKSELRRHQLVHSEEKPFACTKCGVKFRQKRYLNSHVKARHVEPLKNC